MSSNEETNAIISDNGHVSVDAREAAEALAQHYANESWLTFSNYDKHFARVTRNQVKSCRDRPKDNPLFNVDFTSPEIFYALQNLDTIKSPGPDSILDISSPTLEFWVGKALTWISNFLNHQNFCVNCRATFSDSYKTYQGFPQGCVLSPTLFSLFIFGVETYVNPFQTGLFVDDVVLWCSDANISKMESQVNKSLVNIQEFADNHKITLYASKSTVSHFTSNRHLYNYFPEIFLVSEHLNYSKYPTYLGFILDSEVTCGKHIEKIADKARDRLKTLQYLSGKDWGSDASTLRITYTTLVLPVLENGYQIFQVASPTSLKKLESVQLSAASIITGLRYSCPTDIVLYEAHIHPLTMRFEVNSYRYFNKIKSFGSFKRTSSFIINWTSNQRLKRDIPLNYMRKHGFIDFNVDTSTPFSCISPIDSFNHVEFREELLTSPPKHSSHPELLRQLALEVINDVPDQVLIVYTEDSRSDTDRAWSDIFSNTPGNDVKISIRNPDHCSVFRSELIAISGALDLMLSTLIRAVSGS
ncbi:RNA-directed DNA polymerase from mobile element jockey [Trichonephila clavipes]|uniref:RNA-directed DNA polymerase from mobile element jockey n=1 Tax=Trichonephila clavipes TaxID=2585209 RepID=A0A8X6UZQ1_TRICX|nr:RNA-directed DNA polymerase from mobile element jockey [Trichonephila clavipes]